MLKILAVAAGGALGALLRFGLGSWVQGTTKGELPIGTWTVNMLGCFAIGFAAAALAARAPVRAELAPFLIIGLLGAFTTFSAYGFETLQLTRSGHLGRAALYVLASNVVGLAAVWAGFAGARAWFGPASS